MRNTLPQKKNQSSPNRAMLPVIEHSSSVALSIQVTDSYRSEIFAGHICTGEMLPPSRELSASLGVNVHTILKVYQALRDKGLLDIRRGHGACVVWADHGITDDLRDVITHIADCVLRTGLPDRLAIESFTRTLRHGKTA